MSTIKFIIFILFTSLLIYSGCDDSGILPSVIPRGRISFTQSNLKPLNVSTDGFYKLWIGLDSAGNRVWYSAGEFNISSDGTPVDLSGNIMSFVYSGDTSQLYLATKSLVTLEQAHNIFPSPQRLISGNLTPVFDSISGVLNIAGDEAFGNVGSQLMRGSAGLYILNSPTTNNSNCFQGLWFCDTSGSSSLPDSIALPNGGGWTYQGWAVDNSSGQFYSMGKFFDPRSADIDGSGNCAGPNPGYNAPGQDWIQTGGACPPSALNLRSGNYGIFVSLEPNPETPLADAAPFFVRIFNQHVIDQTIGCGQLDNIFSQQATFPTARIRIAF